jgi:hypothetical protein
MFRVFEWEGAAADTVRYVNWLSEMRAGLIGLEMYTPEKHMWGQAHSHARFVLLRVALEAGEDFVRIDETTNADDGKPDLLVTVDKSKVCTVGKRAIAEFLKKLQVCSLCYHNPSKQLITVLQKHGGFKGRTRIVRKIRHRRRTLDEDARHSGYSATTTSIDGAAKSSAQTRCGPHLHPIHMDVCCRQN